MSSHDNKEIVRKAYYTMTQGNPDDLRNCMSSDISVYDPISGQDQNLEELKESSREFMSALSDYHVEIHDMIAVGDTVGAHVTWHGRHTGEFQGASPTGRRVSTPSIDIFRLSGGKIVDWQNVWDYQDFLAQIGAAPKTGRRAA